MRRSLILSLALLVGCGSSAPTVDDVCNPEDGLFLDILDRTADCQPLAALILLQGWLTDAETANACEANVGSYIEDGSTQLGNRDALDACREFLATATCDQLNDRNLDNPCDDVIVGTVAAGGVCEDNEQCAGDAFCDQPDPQSCGFCTLRLADGATCSSAEECLSRRCATGGTGTTCQPLVLMGGTCGSTADCASPYVCNATSTRCEAAPVWAVGTACTPGGIGALVSQCGFPDLYCSAATSMCTAWKEVGETCNPDIALGMACRVFEYQTCQDVGAGLQCQAATIVNVGEECAFDTGRKCADGLQCGNHDNDGVTPSQCYTPLPENAACNTSNSLCDFPLECNDGVCKYGDYSGMCPAPAAP